MRAELVEPAGREETSSCRRSSFPTRHRELDNLEPWNRTWHGTSKRMVKLDGEKELQESENGGRLD